jgi:hypothetical protein
MLEQIQQDARTRVMSRLPLRLVVFISLTVGSAPASAVPPPPPPIGNLAGPGPLCQPAFAFMLAEDESANQYAANHWVVNGPTRSMGIRAYSSTEAATIRDALRGRQELETTFIPVLGNVERNHVVEYPGNERRGWSYWFRDGTVEEARYVAITSDQFEGNDADYPLLRRVLIGEAGMSLCPF